MIVWFTDGQMGLLFAFASTVVGLITNYSARLTYSNPTIYVWNTMLRLGFYLVVVWLGLALKKTYTINRKLARTDYVTGAVSVRYFYELAQLELNRARRYRHPFTLATGFCGRLPMASSGRSARRMRWRAWAATNLPCSCPRRMTRQPN